MNLLQMYVIQGKSGNDFRNGIQINSRTVITGIRIPVFVQVIIDKFT